jgi:excisionase family DNA binding protein
VSYVAFEPPGLYTIPKAAERLNVRYETLKAHVRRGQIPSVTVGRRRYIPQPVLHALETGEGAFEFFGPKA